jgi:hypothetical protein
MPKSEQSPRTADEESSPERRPVAQIPLKQQATRVYESRVMAVRILSESSRIKLDKAGKTAGLQRSKTLDISSRNRKPWKG